MSDSIHDPAASDESSENARNGAEKRRNPNEPAAVVGDLLWVVAPFSAQVESGVAAGGDAAATGGKAVSRADEQLRGREEHARSVRAPERER